MNRRQLLQFFSIGTAITPVVNGAPLVEAAAQLLAVPDLAPLPKVVAQVHDEIVLEFPQGFEPNSRYRDRLKWNPYEAIWLYLWQIENNPPCWLNGGVGPLEHVLGHKPTPEEKAAATSLIQWFGTNCGHAFIAEVLVASGYTLKYQYDNPVQRLQHFNIWKEFPFPMPGDEPPSSVEFVYRGRTVRLKPNSEGEVL